MSKIIVLATPVFFLLMALEWAWGWFRGRNTYRLDDALNSLSLGILSQLSGLFLSFFSLGLYTLIHRHAALWAAPDFWGAWYGWLLALVFYDFCYYWLHRMGHEVALLWAAHVVHHQSQDYNLSTALRQTSSGHLLAWLFYVPMALAGVPPLEFAVVGLIDLLYQFWIHTEQVPRLGWFDRVFASPSNHRVHHAVNDRYLDRNYGGILILWDRLFGTFQEETEPCVYGTRSPLDSWDPLWANAEVYWALLRDAWRTRRWRDRLQIWWRPPGWQPADVAQRFPRPAFDLRQVRRHEVPQSRARALFCTLQFAVLLAGAALFLWHAEGMDTLHALGWFGTLLAGLWALGALLQGRLLPLEMLLVEAATLATVSAAEGLVDWHHLFKPLAMVLALVLCLRHRPASPTAPPWLLLALTACLVGDVCLMFPGGFIPGLAAFLLGHAAYLLHFRRDAPWFPSRRALLATGLAGLLMLAVLWPHLDTVLRLAVPLYVAAISLMAGQALGRAAWLRSPSALGAAAGALCFMLSDSLLAIDRFVSPLPAAPLWVLSSYYLAQILIVHHSLGGLSAPQASDSAPIAVPARPA
ncbi:MAG: sterol desaturase family protein [Curvibacter sp.]|nr:sterol desaturase family protein [Curvibacter sp.]